MLRKLPTFEPVLPAPEDDQNTIFQDPVALSADESFTIGERLAALVAWRREVTIWLSSHDRQHKGAVQHRQLIESIDGCIDELLWRIRNPARVTRNASEKLRDPGHARRGRNG